MNKQISIEHFFIAISKIQCWHFFTLPLGVDTLWRFSLITSDTFPLDFLSSLLIGNFTPWCFIVNNLWWRWSSSSWRWRWSSWWWQLLWWQWWWWWLLAMVIIIIRTAEGVRSDLLFTMSCNIWCKQEYKVVQEDIIIIIIRSVEGTIKEIAHLKRLGEKN